jgi:choline dehydrogenase
MNAEGAVSVFRYLTTRRGMLTSNVAEAGAFVRTRASDPEPDVQYHMAPVLYEDHGLRPPSEHGFSIGPTLVAPRSVGRLALRSADPTEPPLIDPNYLADEADLSSLVAGIKVGREIAGQAPLDPYRGEELTPGVHVGTDDALAAYVRATCETLYHPVGTCRMGPDDDAVVDLDLRVRGVEGLRVVDASVMPTIVRGNTNAPTMMIAEKAATLIRMEWGMEDATSPP